MRKVSLFVFLIFVIFAAFTGPVAAVDPLPGSEVAGEMELVEEENIAEMALWQVADRAMFTRQFYGKTMLWAGGGLVFYGILNYEFAETAYFSAFAGVGLAVAGGFLLLIPEVAELEWQRVKEITDPIEREMAAQSSLNYLAIKAKRSRLISGVTQSALASFYLYSLVTYDDEGLSTMGRDDLLSGFISSTGSAIKAFAFKSYEEEVYQEVLEDKDLKKSSATPGVSLLTGEVNGLALSFKF